MRTNPLAGLILTWFGRNCGAAVLSLPTTPRHTARNWRSILNISARWRMHRAWKWRWAMESSGRSKGGDMTIRVKLFAILREKAGMAEMPLELLEGATIESAIARLVEKRPELSPWIARAAYA